jgi:hypothetical protein
MRGSSRSPSSITASSSFSIDGGDSAAPGEIAVVCDDDDLPGTQRRDFLSKVFGGLLKFHGSLFRREG